MSVATDSFYKMQQENILDGTATINAFSEAGQKPLASLNLSFFSGQCESQCLPKPETLEPHVSNFYSF